MSSTSNLNNTSCQKDIDAVQLLNNNRNKSGDLNEKLKLSWTGDLTSFKRFVEENIAISCIWESPGDERKSYSDGYITIMWWKNKKKLQFSGKEADKIKQTFCNILMGNVSTENNMADKSDEGGYTDTSQRNRGDIAINIERMTLDAVTGLRTEVVFNTQAINKFQNQCSCSEISPDLEDMKLNIELLQSRNDALQSLANAQQVCSPITDCLRNIEILRQELSEERERTQKIEFDFKVFKGENLNGDGFGGQNCKSEYKVANKESPKRDETIPEFQCTEDSTEEISLIINNKPNYEADEYSLNANYDKSSIHRNLDVLKLLLKIHVLLLIQI